MYSYDTKKFARYAKQIARDARNGILQYEKFENGKSAGVEFWAYIGPEAGGNIRPWCAARANRVFSTEEIDTMLNQFRQSAKAFCGGYNCRHRWVPKFGRRVNDNLFINKSYDDEVARLNSLRETKPEHAANRLSILEKEKATAERLSAYGSVELVGDISHLRKRPDASRDADALFNGEAVQLKSPEGFGDRLIKNQLKPKQADTIIIDVAYIADDEFLKSLYGKASNFLKENEGKKVFLLTKYGLYVETNSRRPAKGSENP